MFGLFKKDPTKRLRKQHADLLEKAMHAQRKGDIKTYSTLTAQAEAVWVEIETMAKQSNSAS